MLIIKLFVLVVNQASTFKFSKSTHYLLIVNKGNKTSCILL